MGAPRVIRVPRRIACAANWRGMVDSKELKLTFGARLRLGALSISAGVISAIFEGSSTIAILAVPVLVGLWMYAIVAVDHWVRRGADRL